MKKGKTLFISDLDDTLLDKSSVLSSYTKQALNDLISRGIDFTVATGRSTDAVEKMMSDIVLNIPIVSFNGAAIYDIRHNNYVKVFWISPESIKNVVSILKAFGVSWLMYKLTSHALIAYYDSHEKLITDYVKDRKKRYNSSFCQVNDLYEVSAAHIMYFTLLDSYERLKPICDDLTTIHDINFVMVDLRTEGLWWLEILSAEASKGNAVKFLRETYGYERIIGFGDNYNDLTMFKYCDVRVAVQNALDEIKAAADSICESHDEDGVVKWIENHLSHSAIVE